MANIEHRFWKRVDKSGDCWTHAGSIGSHGYPQYGGQRGPGGGLAHRMAYVLEYGEIPRGMFVCHRCNNKRCVRPSHLYAGTHIQNMDDVSVGGYHPNRKLTDDQVRAMRNDLSEGKSMERLAKSYGVTPKAVSLIRDRVTYRHV